MWVHLINDCCFVVVFYITLPELFPLNGQVFVVPSNFSKGLGAYWSTWFTCLYYYAEILQLSLFPVDFYYRYRVVCKQDIMSSKKLFTMIGMLAIAVFMQTMVLSRYMLKRTAEYDVVLRDALKTTKLPMYLATSTNPILAYPNLVMNMFFILFCYAMCAYVFFTINNVLKRNSRVSGNAKAVKIEKQVTRLMIAQSVVPMFLLSLPVLVTAGCALINVPLLIMGPINKIILSWNGIVKISSTILVVPSYRSFILFKVGAKKNVTLTTISNISDSRVNKSTM
ncbi:unnamed protein product [Bursaphelenchus okinawaensis]|uniref:G_PROTEIN_RECEP_F1_2 domain-containing protein n=1 Tax=Bursaphelenchus okinawaensis TaxID=465554 RepID=A0A811JWM1_9BILA|nr:unnamed protein product [Bursaphelenchus okinawaensis]CAG9086356.1 unnamed protein product [Bursaphelenchus okinawaensis]